MGERNKRGELALLLCSMTFEELVSISGELRKVGLRTEGTSSIANKLNNWAKEWAKKRILTGEK